MKRANTMFDLAQDFLTIEDSKELKNEIEKARIMEPLVEIEKEIYSFLKSRFDKIDSDKNFEQLVQQKILDRIEEANVSQLIMLLTAVQNNSNIATEKVLAPFLPKGDGSPLLEAGRDQKRDFDQEIHDSANSDMLQALSELNSFLGILPKKNNSVK